MSFKEFSTAKSAANTSKPATPSKPADMVGPQAKPMEKPLPPEAPAAKA